MDVPIIPGYGTDSTPQNCLKDVLDCIADSSPGAFASMISYNAPPNPAMTISGFGSLGLPLSSTEAIRLRSVMDQAPFGKGERTVIDKEVRDTWELGSDKVQFNNAEWNAWLEETMLRRVCEDMGIPTNVMPSVQFYKLLLYETGSQCVCNHLLPIRICR